MIKTRLKEIGLLILRFLMFFAILGFCLTCNIMLFLEILKLYVDIEYTVETVRVAALFTFWNAVFLAFAITIVDLIRRKINIDRPLKKIIDATDRIMYGDFSVRIKKTRIPLSMNEFNPIIKNINKMTEELSSIETLRTDFVSNVSHELKTPLSVLQNYAMLLENPDLPEEKRIEYAKSINRVTKYLSSLVTNILRLNKLENQRIRPQAKRFNLSESFCECLIGFENEWEQKNIELICDIDSDIYITSDSEMLNLVWNNLISNALKFTPDGGKVSVSLKRKDYKVVLTVSDTGCGMDENTIKHIFDKFYQGDTSHSEQGNGLGLALVKRVIDLLSGEIEVTSIKGKGSKFCVKI